MWKRYAIPPRRNGTTEEEPTKRYVFWPCDLLKTIDKRIFILSVLKVCTETGRSTYKFIKRYFIRGFFFCVLAENKKKMHDIWRSCFYIRNLEISLLNNVSIRLFCSENWENTLSFHLVRCFSHRVQIYEFSGPWHIDLLSAIQQGLATRSISQPELINFWQVVFGESKRQRNHWAT